MALTIQQLRSNTSGRLPAALEAGQFAVSLADDFLFVGDGTDTVKIINPNGTNQIVTQPWVTGGGTVYGKTPTVPTIATGKGYIIYDLHTGESGGVFTGAAAPTSPAPVAGDLWMDTTTANNPILKTYDGSSWIPIHKEGNVFTQTTLQVDGATGADTSAKITQSLIDNVAAVTGASDLNVGDTAIVTGTLVNTTGEGNFIYDGSNWIQQSASTPDASTAAKGVAQLAEDAVVLPTGAPGATAVPAGPIVATAQQLKALADQVQGLATGAAFLGTYDGGTGNGQIDTASTAGVSAGFANGTKIGGTTPDVGDYFIVINGGTVTGETDTALNVTLTAGDRLTWLGSGWVVIQSASLNTGATLHSLDDVVDSTASIVATTNHKGLLLRDSGVADGLPGAYKLIDVIDLGTF